jgi:hypothetical protein
LRNKIIHNAFGWMTHSVLEGVVRQYDPDTRTFTPLPRALVRVVGITPPSIAGVNAGYAITDSNGFYRIVGLEAGAYVVDAERPGFKTQHPETVVLVAETATINLIMLATPPGQISGRVIDINNQPVRGALVRATNTTDPELTREIVTDPDGTFLIPRVPAGTWNVTVVALAFGGYTLPPVQPTARRRLPRCAACEPVTRPELSATSCWSLSRARLRERLQTRTRGTRYRTPASPPWRARTPAPM